MKVAVKRVGVKSTLCTEILCCNFAHHAHCFDARYCAVEVDL